MNLSCQRRSDHHCVKADNTPHAVPGGTNQTASRRDVCCRSLFDSFAGVSEDGMSRLKARTYCHLRVESFNFFSGDTVDG
jgi:hypothetical protein